MRHVFIINPNSGKSEKKQDLFNQLEDYKDKLDYQVIITKEKGEAFNFIKKYCLNNKEDTIFYACGGDGTINEVASAIVGIKNAILACYPCGSGNDFVKVYGDKEKFLNLDNLLNGKEIKIDIMKVNDKYAINVTNFGFDAYACDIANKVRRKKIIGGKHSYTTGIIASIFKAMKNKHKIYLDGKLVMDGNILLSTIANGKYIGGAYCCAPYSNNQDGLLDVTIVKPMSIFKFATMIGSYKKGTHLKNEKFKKILQYKKATKVVVESEKEFRICLDGEIYLGKKFEITNLKQSIRFIMPTN